MVIVKDYKDVYNYMLDFRECERIQMKKGAKAYSYLRVHSGFDIETTNVITEYNKLAFMYHWQVSLNDMVILGRKWDEFVELLERIKRINELSFHKRIIIWVANLSFEFQFFRKRLSITSIFAKEERQPLLATVNECFEFRDCLAISGGNLSQLAKDYTTTQKLVGDLDYNILRNSTTPLLTHEKNYCINDVVILSEWSDYIFNTYIKPERYVPYTKTGILRRKVKQRAEEFDKDIIHGAIRNCFPSLQLYRLMMKYLFRGGYVHSCVYWTNYVLYDVISFDITSSYPASMLQCYYPMGRLLKLADTSEDNVRKYMNSYCVMTYCTFKKIHTTTHHAIESKSKAVEVVNPIIDNGRIVSADSLSVFITELDFQTYDEFYHWEEVEFHKVWYSKRGKLPNYLLDVLCEEYEGKAQLKKNGKSGTPEYAIKKSNVNSAFGLCVTRMHESNVIYDMMTGWGTDDGSFNYDKEIRNQVLLPQWGIYISAHSRRRILSMAYKMHESVVYIDTDSLKLKNYVDKLHYIEEYNAERESEMMKICSERGLDFELFHDLGSFECEGVYSRFKTLGAKRYLTESDGKYHVTVAGLPKVALNEYRDRWRAMSGGGELDLFELFNDGMTIEDEYSKKLTTKYNDEYTEAYVDGELMSEESSVALYSIPFTLSMKDYTRFILAMHQTMKRGTI